MTQRIPPHKRSSASIYTRTVNGSALKKALPTAGLFFFSVMLSSVSQVSLAQSPDARNNLSTQRTFIPAAMSDQPDESYTLGAGDRIRISIFRVDQYSGDNEVLVDGSLNLPLAGRVFVEGLTLDQAASAIAQAYSRYLREPIVTVNLLAPRPLHIGIAGEVNRPGSYTLPLEGSQFPTLTRLLETAGGITQAADLRQVQVRRSPRAGQTQTITIDLWQLLNTGDLQYDLTLRDGDSIFVPAADTPNLAEGSQLASASFASNERRPINIAVVGEVFRPGPYSLTGGARTAQAGVPGGSSEGIVPTVTRAIQVAGGIKPLADIRSVEIHRATRSGGEQTIRVDLWQLLQEGDLQQDAILQEGDTIVVPTASAIDPMEATQIAAASFSPNTIRINVVGEVVNPGVVEVPPNTPLNQGLLSAGGFNNRASKGSVQLVRLNPNGTVSQREIDIDFTQGANETTNPTLNNNDVVIVGRSSLASISDTLDTALSPLSRVLSLFTLPFNFLRLFP